MMESKKARLGFNLRVIADDEEFDFTFNNDTEELVRTWASAILKIIRKRPFISKNHAKVFIEKSDAKDLPTILNYFHSAGLKYTICKLADFKFVLPSETAILIGTDKFLQFAFDYSFPDAKVAFVPTNRSKLKSLLYDHLPIQDVPKKLLFSNLKTLGVASAEIAIGNLISKKTFFHFAATPVSLFETKFLLTGMYINDGDEHSVRVSVNDLSVSTSSVGYSICFHSSKNALADFFSTTWNMAVGASLTRELTIDCTEFDLTLCQINGTYSWSFGGINLDENVSRIRIKSDRSVDIFY